MNMFHDGAASTRIQTGTSAEHGKIKKNYWLKIDQKSIKYKFSSLF